MSKNTTTISISIPNDLSTKLDELCKELNVGRSALTTAMLNISINWLDKAKEMGFNVDGL